MDDHLQQMRQGLAAWEKALTDALPADERIEETYQTIAFTESYTDTIKAVRPKAASPCRFLSSYCFTAGHTSLGRSNNVVNPPETMPYDLMLW